MEILIVDDDKGAVNWVVSVLQEVGGHRVTKIDTVREAEAAFEIEQWPFGLLILDVHIRDESLTEDEYLTAGLRLHRKFRARFKTAKVLILTNNSLEVNARIWSLDPNTKLEDKVDVAGRRLLDIICNW